MKQRFIILVIVTLVLTGCNISFNVGNSSEDKNKKKEKLTLQLTKVDEEQGITLDDGAYPDLNKAIENQPDIGEANDFSVYALNTFSAEDGSLKFLLIGINRLPMAIREMQFLFTLKNENGDYIYDSAPVTLPESEFGTFDPNTVKPFILDATEEQVEQLKIMDGDNSALELDDFDFEEVD